MISVNGKFLSQEQVYNLISRLFTSEEHEKGLFVFRTSSMSWLKENDFG